MNWTGIWTLSSALARDFFPGSWPRSQRRRYLSSIIHNHQDNQERRCASRLCNKHAHDKRNVEGRNFILLFVRHLSRMPEFVFVFGGEEANSFTTSWDGYSTTYRTGVWHALFQWFHPFIAIYTWIIAFRTIRSIVQLAIIKLISSCRPTVCIHSFPKSIINYKLCYVDTTVLTCY